MNVRRQGESRQIGPLKAGALGLVGLALLSTAAEAKLMRYIIDGKTYSYSTNNDAQTQAAKKRMEAAKRAGSAVKLAHSFKEWKHLQRIARKPRAKIETVRRTPRYVPDAEVTASVSKAPPRPPIPAVGVPRTAWDAAIRSITFDLRSGIKTIHHDDGSVREEPFEAAELQRLSQPNLTGMIDPVRMSEPLIQPDLDSFVDQVRKGQDR
ncbi:MAG TPA: hypothetical protein VG758_26980 [Hyphomicrobiaceae bacterium]|jgi:hypothetical protein|nr:hypothetical protein [Hyphomicrobiaceae bacterium]